MIQPSMASALGHYHRRRTGSDQSSRGQGWQAYRSDVARRSQFAARDVKSDERSDLAILRIDVNEKFAYGRDR